MRKKTVKVQAKGVKKVSTKARQSLTGSSFGLVLGDEGRAEPASGKSDGDPQRMET